MYSLDDCILIRKTDIFPVDGVVETPVHGGAYSFGKSSILGDALIRKLRSVYSDDNEFLGELRKYDVFFETCRSTLSFTLNGIVANSVYGNFSYPCAIVEPFKYHANDDSLYSLRVEDVVYSDDVNLSCESVFFAPRSFESKFLDRDKDSIPTIRYYDGSLDEAISSYCIDHGYPIFPISDHGYTNGLDNGSEANKMATFIKKYARDNNISQEPHFYSDLNEDDSIKRMDRADEIDAMHLNYLLDSGLVSSDIVNKIRELFPNRMYYKKELESLYDSLIDEIGLDSLLVLTDEFNTKMIEDNQSKKNNKNNK